MFDESTTQQMSDSEFRLFADLLRSRAGLNFDAATRFLVEKRIARRMEECDIGSFASYLYHLRHGADAESEFSMLIDVLTTNETYFFREKSQLTALVNEIIPEMISRQGAHRRPVAIWSAGCSSGEEPFSIVMMALEAASGEEIWRTSYPAPFEMNPATARHGEGPKSTPTYADGRLFTLGISGIVTAFDAAAC